MAITLGRRVGESLEITNEATGDKVTVQLSKIGSNQVKLTIIDHDNKHTIMRGEMDPELKKHKKMLWELAKSLDREDN